MSRLSVDSRELIDAARDGDEPTAADRARVRSALARKIALGAAAGAVAATATHAATGATAASAATSAASAASAGTVATAGTVAAAGTTTVVATASIASGIGAKILVSVAIVSAVGAGTVTYAHHEAARHAATEGPSVTAIAPPIARPSPFASPNAIPIAPAPPIANTDATATATPTPTPTPTATATATATPTATATATATANTNAPPIALTPAPLAAPAPSTLDAELSLLQDAHAALRSNDGTRALRLLAEHARRFPNGQLREESEAARVFALCELGRVDEARDVAGRFLREHPTSPLAPRVSRACDGNDAPSTF